MQMMLAEDLRKALLQAAIQGKLVEQRPEEGTGEDLYQQIQEEKAELVKAGKLKKEKPLPEITADEIPFDIPESWRWVRVGCIGSWSAGSTPSRSNSEYYGGNIPWLKTGDLTDSFIDNIPEYITELALKKTSVRLNPAGSVLIAMYGATIGKLGILTIPATTNQACCACICYSGIFNKYLFYYLLGRRKYYIEKGAGGAQPNISKEKIVNSLIPLPPLAEQKRIVEKLDQILAQLADYATLEKELKALQIAFPDDMRKSILQYAMQGKLVEQRPEEGTGEDLYQRIQEEKAELVKAGKLKKGKPLPEITADEIPFDIPESWRWVRLGELLTVISDGTHKTPNYVGSGVPFLSVQNISSGSLDMTKAKYISKEEHEQLIKRVKPQKDDILICRIGTLGKAIKVTWEFEFSIFVSLGLLRPVNPCITDYLIRCINSPVGTGWILENRIGGGTHTFKVNLRDVPKMLIPLPPIAEQRRIIGKLDCIIPHIEDIREMQ